MPPTVRQIIDAARVRHWSFTDLELGDGAVLLYLNQRQRTHLAADGAEIEGLVGTSVQYDLATHDDTGGLYALEDGVPVFDTSVQEGYAAHVDTDGVPYIDTDDVPVVLDPFGDTGATPGFPLPVDMVRLINVGAVYGTDGRNIPVDVIPERERYTRAPGRNPTVFVSGNRLVPVLPFATGNDGDRWQDVTAMQISYVALQTLTSLEDIVTLPSVLAEALTADVALLFARQSRHCDKSDKAGFERDAALCAAAVRDAATNLLESVQQSSVLYRP